MQVYLGGKWFTVIGVLDPVPLAPEQMSVLPLASRWAPEMNEEKKSSFFGAA